MNPNELGSKPFDSQLKTIKLYIYLNNKLILPVDIYPTDTLLDIRQFLSETSQLFFISSYHFEYKGSPLSEFIEISAQKDIDNKARIDIKVDPYDEKSARYHLKKAQELLQHPYSYQNIFGNILRALKDPFLIAQEFKEKEDKFDGRPEEMSIEYWEINQRRFGLNDIIQGKLNDFFEFSSSTKSGNDDLKFVDLLTFSNFNPPPTYRKLKGDFFYLTLKTLENNEYTITSCPRGFYINCSTQTTYSPNPQDSKIYYNILDLVCSLSPLCRKNLQKLIDEEVNEDNFYMKPLNLYTSEAKWLSSLKDNDVQEYKYDQIRNENFLVDLHGFDPSTIRDWNEELQMCKDLPKQDLIQRLNKDKVLLKIHSDFAEAATKGAKGIIDKYIHPLNPQDDEKQQVFVYNQIFFSLVTQTSDSYTQEKGLEAAPTISISNNDLRNLKILHKLDIPELYLLNTAIIDYKGQRILAQTIIPGILNCEQSQRADFGSVDEGKTVHHNEEFNELMKKVCEYFCLSKEVECLDGNNNTITLAGSPEVKGIRSANRKKFLLDLARLSPRDANWLGKEDEYISCVIRPELISHFVISKNFSVANDYIKQEFGERPAEITQKGHEETQIQTRQPFGKYKSSLQEKELYPKKNPTYSDYINRIQEYLLRHEDKNRFRFNSNIYTRTKLANTDSIEFENQKKDLKDLASFIINHSIPNLIKDLVNGDIILPCESKSLGELFHAHGINMRYIGRVCNSIQKGSHAFLHVLLERIMLAKCVKHFLRESLAKMDSAFYAETIAYVFNSIFSPIHIIEKMDSDNNSPPQQQANHPGSVSERTRIDYESPPLEFSTSQNLQKQLDDLLAQKPQKVWDRLREICSRRYLYELPEKIKDFKPFKHRLTKLATLRDVCLSTGIILECKEYNLTNERGGGSLRNIDYTLPFKADDIFDMVPILKHLDPACEDAKSQIELANCLVAERKYEEALENLWGSMQIILNIYGPIHKDIAFCYSKIANIYYQLGEINQAIVNHKQSVKILEKFYGFDNAQTAHGYSSLALLHYYAKQYDKAFACLLKSLYIFNIIGGEFHPECAMILNNLALMYQDMEKSQAAINCLFESLDRNILMYQTDSVKVAYVYQHLALAHLDVNDYVKAIDFQKKCLGIMKRSLPVEDMRIKDAETVFEKINKSVEERTYFYSLRPEDMKRFLEKPKVSKRSKELEGDEEKENQEDIDKAEDTTKMKEKERLLQRLRTAKLNAKYCFRRPGNLDYLRLIQQQFQINGHAIDYTKHPESHISDYI